MGVEPMGEGPSLPLHSEWQELSLLSHPVASREPSLQRFHHFPHHRMSPIIELPELTGPESAGGLLRVSESSGSVQAAPFTPCFSSPNSATAFSPPPTPRHPLLLGASGTRDEAVCRPGLKKFPAGLRLAQSRLHPTPETLAATGSSQHQELQVPASPARALPPLPRPPRAPPANPPRMPLIGLSALSVTSSIEGRVGDGDPDPEPLKGGSGGRRHRRGERSGACPSPGPK